MGAHRFLPQRPDLAGDHRVQMLACAVVMQAFTDIGLLAASAPRLIDRPVRQLARWANEASHWLQDYETLRSFRAGAGWELYLDVFCRDTDPAVFGERFDRDMAPLAAKAAVLRARMEPHLNRLHRVVRKAREAA